MPSMRSLERTLRGDWTPRIKCAWDLGKNNVLDNRTNTLDAVMQRYRVRRSLARNQGVTAIGAEGGETSQGRP